MSLPAALIRLNALSEDEAAAELLRCCGSSRWARAVARLRPFGSPQALLTAADREWEKTDRDDWLEAFSHHPRIGDVSRLRERFARTASWSEQEQKGVAGVSEETLQALAQGNRDYEARFGHIFLVCATGKTADEMLGLLRERMGNAPEREIRIAAGEQAKITRIRLEKMLSEGGAS